jgi:hypothetical protein
VWKKFHKIGLKIVKMRGYGLSKLTFMKNITLLTNILLLYVAFAGCGKSEGLKPIKDLSSFNFSANDKAQSFPVNLAYIQDVLDVHTTLITGQNADTSSKPGSISIRVIGDTTGHFGGDSLLVTYTDTTGAIYYNTHDNGNFVQIDKFTNGQDTIRLTQGVFTAYYQN